MFHRTSLRLTVLNAVVFFVILLGFSGIVYATVQHHLLRKVDASLTGNIGSKPAVFIENQKLIGSAQAVMKIAPLQADVRMITLFWNAKGEPTGDLPFDKESTTGFDFNAFRGLPEDDKPRTVESSGHSYRVLTHRVKNVRTGEPAPSDIVVTQTIINIDPELGMMRSLLLIMGIAVIAGGGAAVMAGSYLARRALVPIRLSWERQQQFVSDASHELRTPLAVIRANTELLLRHPDDTIETQSDTISSMLKETKRLSRLVASLLTLARSDSNQLELAKKRLELTKVLHDAAAKFAPLAAFKGIDMSIDVEEGLHAVGDEERLQQLCVIFLDNALKFTEAGGTIRFICKRCSTAATLVIEDTGMGIAGYELPYIFDRFYQGSRSRSRTDSGSGLGLSIAKWIVEKHGGTIQADSEVGKGTQFAISLPLVAG
ncbi:MAG: HAMP domain-containing histidine kinase [Paenibacillaceae bacterium]|nr:HAMP domain-containing histidine kinase [Paenibacillaceae bacterium]